MTTARAPRWSYSFQSSEKLRDAERAKDEEAGGEACSRGEHCAGRRVVLEGSERKIVPARTYGAFCTSCEALIGRCLSELPPAYVRLSGEIGQPAMRGSTGHSPFGPRLPLRADVDEIMRSMAEVVLSWSERVADTAGLSVDTQASRRGDQVKVLTRAVRVMWPHRLTVLLALEPGPMVRAVPARSAPDVITLLDLSGKDAGLEILQLHRHALLVLGAVVKHREPLVGVPCKRCESFSLERAEPPSDPSREAMWSACAECGHSMPRDQFDSWSRWYSTWADRMGLACKRCHLGRCAECSYANCACAAEGHGFELSA